jgi:hypothetical protein
MHYPREGIYGKRWQRKAPAPGYGQENRRRPGPVQNNLASALGQHYI